MDIWSGLEFVKVLDTLGLVALRRTLVYDYSDFSFIHRMYYFILPPSTCNSSSSKRRL